MSLGELFSAAAALAPLTLCSPDPSDGVLGSSGRGGRGSPLVGHPPGCTGGAAGAGAAGAAHVEGEAWWGAVEPVGAGLPRHTGGLSCCGSHSPTSSFTQHLY